MLLGKPWGLKRLADDKGRFAMVALDQRHPITQAIATARNVPLEEVSFEEMLSAKRLIAKSLAPHATALLVDPNFGVPAIVSELSARIGLVVTLEDHRYEQESGGRRSRVINDWTVEKIRAMGADAVKALVWYRPDASASVRAHQRALVEQVGAECRRHDIAFILELLVYPFPKSSSDGASYAESEDKAPELVVESVREFVDPRYEVDLFKLESPVSTAALPPLDGSPAHLETQEWFDQIGKLCRAADRPWVLLSAGVRMQVFSRVLDYAYRAGASGFLGGRVLWMDALMHFTDPARMSAELGVGSVERLVALRKMTEEKATPWHPSYPALTGIRAEGDFARTYAP